ncbi:hypothetical protein G9A89_016840 [Geosiphon pyriformis]|nr:hypothetical protein G9A89_016840 [Geosiphon pyriformis]
MHPEESKLKAINCSQCHKVWNHTLKICPTCDIPSWTSGNSFIDEVIRNAQINAGNGWLDEWPWFEWISYTEFKNIELIGQGQYGRVDKCDWKSGKVIGFDRTKKKLERGGSLKVALKTFRNSSDGCESFLSELKSINRFILQSLWNNNICRIYGLSKDPKTNDLVLVMWYAAGGNLSHELRYNWTNFSWRMKILLLGGLASGLESIHTEGYVHGNLHCGNILSDPYGIDLKITDIGQRRPINLPPSTEPREVWGVIPYLAPEILQYGKYSPEADIYSFGIIMWEVASRYSDPPFAQFPHDSILVQKILNGLRPTIDQETPDCYAKLMKNCWDEDPNKRPTIYEIEEILMKWLREDMIESWIPYKVCTEYRQFLPNDKAIYISRSLSEILSKDVKRERKKRRLLNRILIKRN